MSLKLNDLPPQLRSRILEQARRDDEAEAATRQRRDIDRGSLPAQERQEPEVALEARTGRDKAHSQSGGQGSSDCYSAQYIIYCTSPYDWDNAAGSIKAVQDALVTEGWLPSDKWDVLRGRDCAAWCEKCEEGEERVEVRLRKVG